MLTVKLVASIPSFTQRILTFDLFSIFTAELVCIPSFCAFINVIPPEIFTSLVASIPSDLALSITYPLFIVTSPYDEIPFVVLFTFMEPPLIVTFPSTASSGISSSKSPLFKPLFAEVTLNVPPLIVKLISP